MLRRTSFLLPLAAIIALVPASGAQAAKATFSAVFEGQRSVAWDQPRTVSSTTCRGDAYSMANGGEEASLKTKPFKVTVETFGPGPARWTFDKGKVRDPSQYGVEGKGPHKRWFEERRGTTGGWCGGGEIQPQPERDCGAELPSYLVTFDVNKGVMSWAASYAPWMANEKLGFYTCTLIVPAGMHNSSFPKLEATFKQSDLFNRRKPKVVIGNEKSYGPDLLPITNSGVNRTTKGSASWKLTLTRKR